MSFTDSGNYEKVPISIWKTDFDNREITTGASFALYRAENFNDDTQQPIESDQIVFSGTTGQNGILSLGELELGEYQLVETKAPAGYIPAEHAIKIFVYIKSIDAIQETGNSDVYYKGDDCWVSGQDERTAQIRIWNTPGVELPSTGGPGTALYTAAGLSLILGASLWQVLRRRKEQQN